MTDTTKTEPKPPVEPPCATCGSDAHTSGYHENIEPTGYHENSAPTGGQETNSPTGYHEN